MQIMQDFQELVDNVVIKSATDKRLVKTMYRAIIAYQLGCKGKLTRLLTRINELSN